MAPPGLPALDTSHPAIVVVILQVLVAVTGSLPNHRLALHGVLVWLERHHKALLDLVTWVTRLPLEVASEPRTPSNCLSWLPSEGRAGGAASFGGVGATGAGVGRVSSVAGSSALLVLCAASSDASDHSLSLVASVLSGHCGVRDRTTAEDADQSISLSYRCVSLITELWGLLLLADNRCVGDGPQAQKARSVPPWAFMDRLAPLFDGNLTRLLNQMSCVVPAVCRDAEMRSAGNTALSDGALRVAALDQRGSAVDDATMGLLVSSAQIESGLNHARATRMGDPNKGSCALYPSEDARLALCVHVLHSMRYDLVARQIQWLIRQRRGTGQPKPMPGMEQNNAGGLIGGPGGMEASSRTLGGAPQDVLGTAALTQLIIQARSRAHVLCNTFVHACSEFLSLRFVTPAAAAGVRTGLGGTPHLQFDGSCSQLRQLMLVVEMSLHLLHQNLSALVVAAAAGGGTVMGPASATGVAMLAPASGAPRLSLVVQYLRMFRQFSAGCGGAIAPVSPLAAYGGASSAHTLCGLSGAQTSTVATRASAPSVKAIDLGFATSATDCVERLLLDLQNL